MITGIQKNPPRAYNPEGALTKTDAIRRFSEYENQRIQDEKLNYKPLPQNPSVLEIYKFGMYKDNTAAGLGHYFLPAVMEMIFNGEVFHDQDGPQLIYLDTRDTNPRGTLTFYLKNGLSIFAEEALHNDLDFNIQSFGPINGDAVKTTPPEPKKQKTAATKKNKTSTNTKAPKSNTDNNAVEDNNKTPPPNSTDHNAPSEP